MWIVTYFEAHTPYIVVPAPHVAHPKEVTLRVVVSHTEHPASTTVCPAPWQGAISIVFFSLLFFPSRNNCPGGMGKVKRVGPVRGSASIFPVFGSGPAVKVDSCGSGKLGRLGRLRSACPGRRPRPMCTYVPRYVCLHPPIRNCEQTGSVSRFRFPSPNAKSSAA